ncbi:serine-threonine kinase receptor-associated protein-like [Pollicipes pollicipes]|uniref:serine-threonine kinase receptor-associated protein-like n=1 Tax=Pollicipes pollicipes TaxID=41117 RepID=UPI0018859849|nr:serine-threonine kinase receptor-associated protein-like [Pollicipes pollicipes]
MAALRQTPLTCSGHTRPVVDLDFSSITPEGYFMVSACKDGKPMLRQGDTGDWVGTFEGHKGAVWGVALNNDASRVATGAADFTAKLWDAQSGEELRGFQHKHIVKSVDFSADAGLLLTGSNEKMLRIYDLAQPEAEPQLFKGHTASIKKVMFLPDGETVISCGDDKSLRVWDRRTGEATRTVELPAAPMDVEVSADGQTLTVTHGKTVSFRSVESLEEFKSYSSATQLFSASLHPSQSVFVCGGEDFIMYKYDYATGAELEACKGHFGPVHVVRFSPDGELYASGSEDGTLRLWQTTVGKTYGLWKCVEATIEAKPEQTAA